MKAEKVKLSRRVDVVSLETIRQKVSKSRFCSYRNCLQPIFAYLFAYHFIISVCVPSLWTLPKYIIILVLHVLVWGQIPTKKNIFEFVQDWWFITKITNRNKSISDKNRPFWKYTPKIRKLKFIATRASQYIHAEICVSDLSRGRYQTVKYKYH